MRDWISRGTWTLFSALLAAAPAAGQGPPGHAGPAGGGVAIEARIWLDRGRDPVVHRGDRVRLYYRTARDAYVAVFHVDTDGNVSLAHPRYPGEDHYVRAGRDYRVIFPRSPYWHVDESPGLGYFFVVASSRPMDFSRFHYSHGPGAWDLSRVGRTVYGDPYAAMDAYVEVLIPRWDHVSYGLGFVEYHVGRAYRYPRFLCYDCHGFRPYDAWNPYRYSCRSFRVVIHTDPLYYPVRRYGPRRVVYKRSRFTQRPRFTFKERAAGAPGTPLVRRRAKPRETAGRDDAVRREARPRSSGVRRRNPTPLRAPDPEVRRDRGEDEARRAGARRRPTSILPDRRKGAALRGGGPGEPGEVRSGIWPRARTRSGTAEPRRPGGRSPAAGSSRPFLRPRSAPSRTPSVRAPGGDARSSPAIRRRAGAPSSSGVRPPRVEQRGRKPPSARPSAGGAASPPAVRRPAPGSRGGLRRPPPRRRKPPDGGR